METDPELLLFDFSDWEESEYLYGFSLGLWLGWFLGRFGKQLHNGKSAFCLCGTQNTTLHVHHNTYERVGNELPTDVVVLCAECHAKFHGIKKDGS